MKKIDQFYEFCASRSLFFPSAEIYSNSFAGFYEYGPLGNLIRINLINFWRNEFVRKNDFFEISGSIILPKEVFVSSGHLGNFDDPIASCQKCKQTYKLDKLISSITKTEIPEKLTNEEYQKLIDDNNITCTNCKGKLGEISRFNLMASINVGAQSGNLGYLRGETCQSIFLDFLRIYKTSRKELPIVISQHGKVYRNEIAPRNGLLRCREFEQLEAELFFDADEIDKTPIDLETIKDYKVRLYLLKDNCEKEYTVKEINEQKISVGKIITYYLYLTQKFLEDLGFKKENIRYREVPENDKAFYSKQTFDLEVLFNEDEWIELFSVNYRTDHDLKSHGLGSKKELLVSENGKKITPHVLEICSIGLDRLFLVLLENSFCVKQVNDENRNVLLLKPKISPYFCSILPLMKKDGLFEKATDILNTIKKKNPRFEIFFDEKGSIGKRYARLDEIGCNYCLTIDHQTLEDNTVTIRDRNSFDQKRININDLFNILENLYFEKIDFTEL